MMLIGNSLSVLEARDSFLLPRPASVLGPTFGKEICSNICPRTTRSGQFVSCLIDIVRRK